MAGADADRSSKPWKQKQNKKLQPAKSIEIFEGKVSVPTSPLLETTPADSNGYIRIVCKDEAEFFVPVKVVEQLKCVDVILHGEVNFKEKVEKLIRFPDFRKEVLESVMRFVFIEYIDDLKAKKYWGQNAPRVAFQFGVEPGEVMELVYAAHFFGIKNLLQVAASMIAHHLKDVPDVSSMPPDLAWCVAEQFSPQDLYYAEERPDFASLNLQTSSLWEKHCRKILQDDCISISSVENYPSYDEWSSEGPPPTSWKSLYMSVYLQQLADRQDGASNDSFFEEVSRKGQWAYTHTIRSTFWQWVFAGKRKSLSLDSYAAQFPNLLSLCIAKVPLGDKSILVGKFLQLMKLLQLLDISETGFTSEAAIELSESLRLHTRLQVLRAACNCIGTEGYVAIARASQYSTSLKVLDVRDNNIGYAAPGDAVAASGASALEEIYFDGNFNDQQNRSSTLVPIFAAVPASLKFLHLQRCDLKDKQLRLLAQALHEHSSIQKLDLSDNKITSDGASALLLWLQNNTSLVELAFSYNNITDSCSSLLCEVLQSHTSLEKLSLKGNYSYGEENLPQVIAAASSRGDRLHESKQKKFILDLRSTDVSFANQARIQRQAVHFVSLHLLI